MEELAWVWAKEQFALLQHGLRLLLIFWTVAVPALWKFSLANSQALNHLALILAGIIGIPLLWVRTRAADRQARAANEHAKAANEQARVANEQAKTANEQARVANVQAKTAEQGHITDRFTKAIEQLGSEKLAVRLGAIYALERLSKDSHPDYWTIMEVLTAYVQDNAPWPPKQATGNPFIELQGNGGNGAVAAREQPKEEVGWEKKKMRPATDIQVILTVLGRREEPAIVQHKLAIRVLELQGTDLRGADLVEGHLEGSDLRGAHLEGASLLGAHLEGASLVGAHLEGADLTGAHLEGARLDFAHLEGASLSRAHLEGASLGEAHLEGASLNFASLEETSLAGAHLEAARLFRSKLKRADLHGAHLKDAVLNSADLREALNLSNEQIKMALGNEQTLLPKDLLLPVHWLNLKRPSPITPPPSQPPQPEPPAGSPNHTSR